MFTKYLTLFIGCVFFFFSYPQCEIIGNEITPQAQESIARSLKFLSKTQDEEGFWRCDIGYKLNVSYKVIKENRPHVGITALACMAFLANGNLPDRGPYAKNLARGIEFILSCAHPATGYISRYNTRMYSHAFATLFLAEVYGMTQDPKLRPVLERAIRLILECQNDQGGWRYEPIAMDADMSITVCQVQALRAARNIGIRVPKKNIDRAIEYIRKSAGATGGFRYQLMALSESRTSFSLTAAGITALFNAGVYDDESIEKGLKYLMYPPRYDPHPPSNHYFFYYGHYYAIQAMYMAGGEYWSQWYPKIREQLLQAQYPDGSWEDNVGKTFATPVATIILQIPYGYLPIFQK